jgi:hypothetical protein
MARSTFMALHKGNFYLSPYFLTFVSAKYSIYCISTLHSYKCVCKAAHATEAQCLKGQMCYNAHNECLCFLTVKLQL